MTARTYRQFFRIVTAEVSFWYKDHSTVNPLGVQPDPNITKIVVGNKFSEEGVKIVKNDQDLVDKNEEHDKELVKKSAKISEEVEIRCKWHKLHSGECNSTSNPLGVQQDPNITKIGVGNRFSEEGFKIVKNHQDLVDKNEENDGEPVKKSVNISEEVKIRCEWHKIHSGECSGGLSDGEIEEDESD